MNICVLGWGSLIWDPRNLKINGEWNNDGPNLPIEFAKISSGNRLTLVIKPDFDEVQTLWASSSFDSLDAARNNLMDRERCQLSSIGYFDFCKNTYSIKRLEEDISEELISWNVHKRFDAIIWTDLGPNFYDRTNNNFTVENVIQFLDILPPNDFLEAKRYILNTPSQIQTRFRKSLEGFLATKQ